MKRIATAFVFFAISAMTATAMADDAKIAGQLKTVNDAEIAAGKDAKSKATSQEVKTFAQNMVDEHTKNNKESEALAKKSGMQPNMETQDAKLLKADANRRMESMKDLKGSQYDKAYVDSQVAMHRQTLKDLDKKHIPQAENQEFKTFLTTTRQHVQDHLNRAMALQSNLTGLASGKQKPSMGTSSGTTSEPSGSESSQTK